MPSEFWKRYAEFWSKTENIERRYSLHDRYQAIKTLVHAIDHVVATQPDFLTRVNACQWMFDGIYNALDHRSTGREWRNIRHTYNNERDGPHPPQEAEEDRRCDQCGAIRPERFTHCHAKNHVPSRAPVVAEKCQCGADKDDLIHSTSTEFLEHHDFSPVSPTTTDTDEHPLAIFDAGFSPTTASKWVCPIPECNCTWAEVPSSEGDSNA